MPFSSLCLLFIFAVFIKIEVFCGNSRELRDTSRRLRTQITEHFSENRHHDVNPTNKDNVRNYIKEAMEGSNLEIELQHFSSSYEGTNIIGVLPGLLRGTADDQVILLGAHYDSVESTPGVDDNGSGMAVLLEVAAVITSRPQEICIGSQYFVQKWLLPFLANGDDVVNSLFQGALIIETAMNYNNTDNSQNVPYGFQQIFPETYTNIQNRGFRGDFLNVIGRRTDADFSDKFVEHLAKINHTQPVFYAEIIKIPTDGVPTEYEKGVYADLFRSDHQRFWGVGPPYLNALFITDSANFRSSMDACYHQECDNLALITDDNLLFLAMTTKAATTMPSWLSNIARIPEASSVPSEDIPTKDPTTGLIEELGSRHTTIADTIKQTPACNNRLQGCSPVR
uniref:Uncharacterized protein LOC102808662 n=1 Tax=Saccoglossus kowalevskii TaxID=10224 RepID=A0ABM0M3P3_SACKO